MEDNIYVCEECYQEFEDEFGVEYLCEECRFPICPRCEMHADRDEFDYPREYYGNMEPVCRVCQNEFYDLLRHYRDEAEANAAQDWEESF